jgi:hypothetical protein
MLNIGISIFFFLLSCILYAKTASIPKGTRWDLLGARFFPRVILVSIGVLSLIILFFSVRNYLESRRRVEKGEPKGPSEYKEVAVIFLSMFLYLAGFEVLGFLLASVLFLSFLQWYLSQGTFPYRTLVLPLASVGVIYFIFSRFLNVLFPPGLFDLGF